jgi:ABC-type transporter Mla subunit MlaD
VIEFDRDMSPLTNKSDEQLQGMLAQINQAFREVAEKLNEDERLVDAVKTLLRSESVLEDYTTLLVSEPEIIKQLIGSSLSALVNVHLMVMVGDELKRREDVG